MYGYGVKYSKFSVREEKGIIELHLFCDVYSNISSDNSFNLHEILQNASKDEWFDIDNEVYFFYWHLKNFLKVMNSSIAIESISPISVRIKLS